MVKFNPPSADATMLAARYMSKYADSYIKLNTAIEEHREQIANGVCPETDLAVLKSEMKIWLEAATIADSNYVKLYMENRER